MSHCFIASSVRWHSMHNDIVYILKLFWFYFFVCFMLYGIHLLQSTQNRSDFCFMWLYILHDLANEWMNLCSMYADICYIHFYVVPTNYTLFIQYSERRWAITARFTNSFPMFTRRSDVQMQRATTYICYFFQFHEDNDMWKWGSANWARSERTA